MLVTESQRKALVDLLSRVIALKELDRVRLNGFGRVRLAALWNARANISADSGDLLPHDKQVVLEILYDRLVADTVLEATGELNDTAVAEVEQMRVLASQLISDMQFRQLRANLIQVGDVQLSHAELTRMGLYDMVPTEKIDGYAKDRGQLSKVASFLLKKNKERGRVYPH